jgi:hypothetical protein
MDGASRTLADAQMRGDTTESRIACDVDLATRRDAVRASAQKGCWMFSGSSVRRLLRHHAQQNGRIAMAI